MFCSNISNKMTVNADTAGDLNGPEVDHGVANFNIQVNQSNRPVNPVEGQRETVLPPGCGA